MHIVLAEECAKNGILRERPLPRFYYLARNQKTVADSKHLFLMQELNSGYDFIPIQQQPADCPETADPDQIQHWKTGTFQGRSVSFFEHEGKRYGVAIAVDGQALRFKHYTGLNRKGGRIYP